MGMIFQTAHVLADHRPEVSARAGVGQRAHWQLEDREGEGEFSWDAFAALLEF